MAEMRATSAVLLRNFRFAPDTEKPVQRIATAVLRSTTGVHVKVSLRELIAVSKVTVGLAF